eukprot:symbB.v1.2.000704.t1/scaffold40.1/size395337/8
MVSNRRTSQTEGAVSALRGAASGTSSLATSTFSSSSTAILATSAAAATLALQRRNQARSGLKAFEQEAGVQAPLGFWDPLGLSTSGNVSDYKRRREVELKHGRVAMFATIGYILPEYWRFPGYLSKFLDIKFAEVPNGLSAFSKVPSLGWLQIVGFAGIVELNIYNEQVNDEPGNYGAGFLGLRSVGFMNAGIADPELRKKKLNAELANGRLAMFAIIGMFFQDGLTGSAWGDWSLYTDSPLRAFEEELGVQAPVGFWDPVGYTRDGDIEIFKRRRETEIKHGRVAMYATIGYIVPEYFKWPGYLSPSMGLKFADVPNGLAAIGKVPGNGWAQIVAFAGYYELSVYQYKGVPGEYGWKAISSQDPEVRKRKLNAELANGRLASRKLNASNATIGYIVPEYFKWPGYLSPSMGLKFADVPNGLAAIGKVPGNGWAQIVAFAGYYELSVYQYKGVPGEYGWKAISSQDPEVRKRKLNAELANGRLASRKLNASNDGLTGSAWGDWSLYTDSPLRAFEEELGVQAPVGFWDPVGYTRDGDIEIFKRRRETEIKHGRVAMYATIGYIVPEYFKWPGYLSPSMGLKFADVPNGLAAIGKVPGNGWAQIVAFAGYYELSVYQYKGVPGEYGWKAISSQDPEVRKRKLNAELANGRLASRKLNASNATIGYIVPEYFKWPGYLSPSMGLKFADVPNGLAAIGKVPGNGWAQIVAFAGYYELSVYRYKGVPGEYGWKAISSQDPEVRKRKLNAELANGRLASRKLNASNATIGYIVPEYFKWPGYLSPSMGLKFADVPNGLAAIGKVPGNGEYGWKAISSEDPEVRKRKLNAELANGRLAMMAIIGMFFQDGLTGSAWGDWSLYTDSPLR